MMRHSSWLQVEQLRQLLARIALARQQADDFQPAFVGQGLEELDQIG